MPHIIGLSSRVQKSKSVTRTKPTQIWLGWTQSIPKNGSGLVPKLPRRVNTLMKIK